VASWLMLGMIAAQSAGREATPGSNATFFCCAQHAADLARIMQAPPANFDHMIQPANSTKSRRITLDNNAEVSNSYVA
jgi:hypothetical protein